MAGMKVEPLDSFPPNANPYTHDFSNMGYRVGTNVTVMFGGFPSDRHEYLIVVDTETGERVRIDLSGERAPECTAVR